MATGESEMNVTFLGASPGTSNMGVSALYATMVAGVARRLPEATIRIFDPHLGRRAVQVRVDSGEPISVEFQGVRHGRRYHRPENISQARALSRFGSVARHLNPVVRIIDESDCLLDVSGGDSFTDLYPDSRMDLVAGGKELVLDRGRPLVLLPQTYGPFTESRDRAARIVKMARAAWARDARSFAVLKDLLGDDFDPGRHHLGVDMAFLLEPRPPTEVPAVLERPRESGLIGLNVSGLMYNEPAVARSRYGFVADYAAVIDGFLDWVLSETDADVVLVPHVMAPPPSRESDVSACLRIMDHFKERAGDRLSITSTDWDQNEVKWAIARCDWFCGTRMHATIAGLSTCTPTSTVSYSDKALGVFECCGQGREVFDPRVLETRPVVEEMIGSYRRRDELRAGLEREIPGVKALAENQMDEIVEVIKKSAVERLGAGVA